MFSDLEGQIERLYTEIIELVYYMRGGIHLSEGLEMSTVEKTIAVRWLNKHLEREFKRPYPNY